MTAYYTGGYYAAGTGTLFAAAAGSRPGALRRTGIMSHVNGLYFQPLPLI
jgi:hypothetical protein